MKFSIRSVLVIALVGLQLVAVATILLSSYLTSERVLLGHARDLMMDVANETIEHSINFRGADNQFLTTVFDSGTIGATDTLVVNGTDLADKVAASGVKNLVLVGFMTHMCVNSTTRASFNHGYANTVVAGATATRSIPNPATGADYHAPERAQRRDRASRRT